MAKSVGSIIQTVNGRILTTREASRLAQNERRKAQRRLARLLTEETGQKVDWKTSIQTFESMSSKSSEARALAKTIKDLQSVTSGKSKQRKGYSVSIERQAESIAAYTQIRYGRETLSKKGNVSLDRRNKMFERQINQSTMKNGLSALSREKTKAFYASTMDLWQGLSNADNRNVQIMQKFGVNNLEQVYKLMTDKKLDYSEFGFSGSGFRDKDGNTISYEEYDKLKNKEGYTEYSEEFDLFIANLDANIQFSKRREIVQEELKKIEGSRKIGGTTNDNEYNDSDEKTPETSPEYINRIISRIANALNNV